MATPLKLKDANGNIQELTTTEENYIAYQVGLHLSTADSAEVGSLNRATTGDTVGTYSNTFFNQAVGTHPSTSITTGTTNTVIYQTTGTAAETDANVFRPIMWVDSASETGFKMMPDVDLNAAVDRYLSKIFTNEYPGSYRLSTSAPSSDWTEQQTAFIDTRTDGASIAHKLWKRTGGTAPTAVKPMRLKNEASFAGVQEMSDTEIKFSFGQRAKTRIAASKIGSYQLRNSSQGAPTDTGTWVAKGTATDTKNTTADVNFTRDSTVNFQASYTASYTGAYTTNYTSITDLAYISVSTAQFSANYSRDFGGTFATTYTASYEGGYTTTYARNFAANYVSNYASTQDVGYLTQYTRNFSGNFTNTFAGGYTRNFTGNFTGVGPNITYQHEGTGTAYELFPQYTGTMPPQGNWWPYDANYQGGQAYSSYRLYDYYVGNYVAGPAQNLLQTNYAGPQTAQFNRAGNQQPEYNRGPLAGYEAREIHFYERPGDGSQVQYNSYVSISWPGVLVGYESFPRFGIFGRQYIRNIPTYYTGQRFTPGQTFGGYPLVNYTSDGGNYQATGLLTSYVRTQYFYQGSGRNYYYQSNAPGATYVGEPVTYTGVSPTLVYYEGTPNTSTSDFVVALTANYQAWRDFFHIVYTRNFLGYYTGPGVATSYTRNTNVTYTRNFTGNFTNTFANQFSATYTTTYTGDYQKEFANSYVRDFSATYSRNFEGTGYVTQYESIYTGAYTTQYTLDYEGNYVNTYEGNYATVYSRDFETSYITDYLGNFTGNFAGETIQSANETNETYTLYVRIS